jgi:hypothetical protein
MFAGFLWLCVSPLIFKTKPMPAPVDPENAYFLGKGEKRSSPFSYERKTPPYNYRYRHYRPSMTAKSANPKMTAQWLKAQSAWTTTTVDSLATPPPAYRSSSTRTPLSAMDTTTFSSFTYTPMSAYKATHRVLRKKSTIPSIKITRSPSMPTISRPIPHPDVPLPGPRLDLESNDMSDTTFLHPNAMPESPIMKTPMVSQPMPYTAVVHANNNTNPTTATIETNLNGHDHATAAATTDSGGPDVSTTLRVNLDSNPCVSWRLSQCFVDWDKHDDSVFPLSPSKIGIAI